MAVRSAHRTPVLVYIILAAAAAFFLVPIYMALVTALKSPSEISLVTAWLPPVKFYWKSFVDAFNLLGPNFKNSLILTISATVISSMIGSINGFVFAKNKFPGSEILFVLFLFGMFIPYQIILIPLFQTLRTLKTLWNPLRAHPGPCGLRHPDCYPGIP